MGCVGEKEKEEGVGGLEGWKRRVKEKKEKEKIVESG